MNFIILCLVSFIFLLDKPDKVKAIVGGRPTKRMVPFHVQMTCYEEHLCGGALITTRHVLTAAHCIEGAEQKYCNGVKIVAGTKSRHVPGQYIMAESFWKHPQYSSITQEHDIGVIKLQYAFTLFNTIQPIRLPPNPPKNNERIFIFGYGRINPDNDQTSVQLKIYRSRLMTYEKCRSRASVNFYPTEICDSGRIHIGTCQGDSGSPVINNRHRLVGVVSRGGAARSGSNLADCTNGSPNVFTSVYHHLDFIYHCISL